MPENAKHGPRLSFSQDFCHYDSIPIEQSPLRTHSEPSTLNFDFSIPGGVISGECSWSAEDFFSDGKILPTEIKKVPEKDGTGLYTNPIGDTKPRPTVNPCWGIKKRSERLNPEIGLPLLSDNPTGSNYKQTETMKLEVSSPSSSSNCSSQKPLLSKTSHGDYSNGGNGGGINVNSFLDVFPGGSLFGLGSIIVGSGSDKNKNKKKKISVFCHW
ncbi:BnaAnng22500D [Brassica napus]|uniref:BnaAnng22500D protein n=1 Tax=Brassica napus TaxID=3708 RepID=A0A078JIP2_BRANA|nr:BnaAnng22500D [Brassica napus]